jgi:hypothetical protein
MNTTYDEILKFFILNCGTDTSKLPTDVEKIYDIIRNGVSHYNTYISHDDKYGKLLCDDTTETLNVNIDNDTRLLVLAYCIKYVQLENQLVEFEELWSPFQGDIGISNYNSQIKGRENTLERTKQKIIELVSSIEDKSIM